MTQPPSPRPFSGPELSKRQKKQADKRAAARAAARAVGMPPPELVDRVDPVTGKPVYLPEGLDPRRAGGAPLPDTVARLELGQQPLALPTPTSDAAPSPMNPLATPGAAEPVTGRYRTPFGIGDGPEPAALPAATSPASPISPGAPAARAASTAWTPVPQTPALAHGQGPVEDQAELGDLRPRKPRRTERATKRQRPEAFARPSATNSGRRWRRGAAPAPSLAEQAQAQERRDELAARLSAPATGRLAVAALMGGCLSAVIAVALALALTTTAAQTSWGPLAACGVAIVAGTSIALRGWGGTPGRLRTVVAGLSLLAVSALVVGALTNPVVVDQRVLPNSSTQARSVRLSDEIAADLRRMAQLDLLLTADATTARARVRDYDPAGRELTSMSAKWAKYTEFPDPAFAPVIDSMATAANWQAEAMASRLLLIEEDDSKTQELLATQRASFTESWLAAGAGLREVSVALGFPLTIEEGPSE